MKQIAILLIVVLVGAAPVFTADPLTDPPSATFEESLEVRLMELEVFVEDSRGQPVRDLSADDFTLLVNREPVPISHFHIVDGAGQRPGVPADPGEPNPGHPTEPLQIVFCVDNLNLDPLDGRRLRPVLSEFLESRASAGDKVMIVTSGRELVTVQPFTSDQSRLAAALASLSFGDGALPAREAERRELLREIAQADSAEAVVGRIRIHAEEMNNETDQTLGSLEQLIGVLAGVPGRKSLLYVSNGLPLNSAEELYSALEDKFQKSGTFRTSSTRTMTLEGMNYDISDRFAALADLAGRARVAFYTLEAPGRQTGGGIDVQTGGNRYYSALTDGADRDLGSSLRLLAGETGGISSKMAVGQGGVLDSMVSDAGSYYSLAFAPSSAAGSGPSRIKVTVAGRGLRVRHRKVLRPGSTAESMADSLRAALSAGLARNPLQVRLELGEARLRPGGDLLIPVEVHVPIDRLLLLPREGVLEGHLRFWLAARIGRGVNSAVVETPLPPPIRIPRELLQQALGEEFIYRVNVALPPGVQHLAVGVRDDVDSVTSITTTEIPAGNLPPAPSNWG